MAYWLCLTDDEKDTWISRGLKDTPVDWLSDVPAAADLENRRFVIEAFSVADKKEAALKAIAHIKTLSGPVASLVRPGSAFDPLGYPAKGIRSQIPALSPDTPEG